MFHAFAVLNILAVLCVGIVRGNDGKDNVDVIFCVDTSVSIPESLIHDVTGRIRKAIQSLSERAGTKYLVGACSFNSEVSLVHLGNNFDDIAREVSAFFATSRSTATDVALANINVEFFSNQSRTDACKIAVIFTDGFSNEQNRTLSETAKLAEKGVHLIVVATGALENRINWRELVLMTNNESRVFPMAKIDHVLHDHIISPTLCEHKSGKWGPKVDMMFFFNFSHVTYDTKDKILKSISYVVDHVNMHPTFGFVFSFCPITIDTEFETKIFRYYTKFRFKNIISKITTSYVPNAEIDRLSACARKFNKLSRSNSRKVIMLYTESLLNRDNIGLKRRLRRHLNIRMIIFNVRDYRMNGYHETDTYRLSDNDVSKILATIVTNSPKVKITSEQGFKNGIRLIGSDNDNSGIGKINNSSPSSFASSYKAVTVPATMPSMQTKKLPQDTTIVMNPITSSSATPLTLSSLFLSTNKTSLMPINETRLFPRIKPFGVSFPSNKINTGVDKSSENIDNNGDNRTTNNSESAAFQRDIDNTTKLSASDMVTPTRKRGTVGLNINNTSSARAKKNHLLSLNDFLDGSNVLKIINKLNTSSGKWIDKPRTYGTIVFTVTVTTPRTNSYQHSVTNIVSGAASNTASESSESSSDSSLPIEENTSASPDNDEGVHENSQTKTNNYGDVNGEYSGNRKYRNNTKKHNNGTTNYGGTESSKNSSNNTNSNNSNNYSKNQNNSHNNGDRNYINNSSSDNRESKNSDNSYRDSATYHNIDGAVKNSTIDDDADNMDKNNKSINSLIDSKSDKKGGLRDYTKDSIAKYDDVNDNTDVIVKENARDHTSSVSNTTLRPRSRSPSEIFDALSTTKSSKLYTDAGKDGLPASTLSTTTNSTTPIAISTNRDFTGASPKITSNSSSIYTSNYSISLSQHPIRVSPPSPEKLHFLSRVSFDVRFSTTTGLRQTDMQPLSYTPGHLSLSESSYSTVSEGISSRRLRNISVMYATQNISSPLSTLSAEHHSLPPSPLFNGDIRHYTAATSLNRSLKGDSKLHALTSAKPSAYTNITVPYIAKSHRDVHDNSSTEKLVTQKSVETITTRLTAEHENFEKTAQTEPTKTTRTNPINKQVNAFEYLKNLRNRPLPKIRPLFGGLRSIETAPRIRPNITYFKQSKIIDITNESPISCGSDVAKPCVKLPVPGQPIVFRLPGIDSHHYCVKFTQFVPETCECSRRIDNTQRHRWPVVIQGMVCSALVYLPFDNDWRDHSGQRTHVTITGSLRIDTNIPGALGTGVGFFDGTAYIQIPITRGRLADKLAVRLRHYTPPCLKRDKRARDLIIDSCTDAMLDIYEEAHATSATISGRSRKEHVSVEHTDDWRDVVFSMNLAHAANLTVNGKSVTSSFHDVTYRSFSEALKIGGGCGQNFVGYLDEVYVYECYTLRK